MEPQPCVLNRVLTKYAVSCNCMSRRQMAGVLRSLRMGFRCLAEPNLQSTQPWSAHCTVTAGPDRVQPTHQEWLWRQQDAAKSGDTRSSWGQARSRLVVFGVEVGGRWSRESQDFISQVARARARREPPFLRRRAEQPWRIRWGSMVSCVVARAVADSLLGLPRALGADGDSTRA